METGSRIPLSMSLSNMALTSALKWCGTGIGVCVAYGTASGFKKSLHGGGSEGKGTSVLLNILLANASTMYCLSFGTFSDTGR